MSDTRRLKRLSEPLDAKEENALKYLTNVIAKNDKLLAYLPDEKTFLNQVQKIDQHSIVRFTSSKNGEVFRHFCATDSAMEEYWSRKLREPAEPYPCITITTMDHRLISPFEHFVAATYYGEYMILSQRGAGQLPEAQVKAIEALDMACEKGLYNALCTRFEVNLKKLQKNIDDQALRQVLLNDAASIANHYWTYGYIKANTLLNKMAHVMNQSSRSEEKLESSENISDLTDLVDIGIVTHNASILSIIHTSLEYLISAYLLRHHAGSKAIFDMFADFKPDSWVTKLRDKWDESLARVQAFVEKSKYADFKLIYAQAEKKLKPIIEEDLAFQRKLAIAEAASDSDMDDENDVPDPMFKVSFRFFTEPNKEPSKSDDQVISMSPSVKPGPRGVTD